jgi:hypothetical protein
MLAQLNSKTQNPKMADRKVILELSEHDAVRLLTLIENQLNEGDKVWHNYWTRLAEQVKRGIEQSSSDYKIEADEEK